MSNLLFVKVELVHRAVALSSTRGKRNKMNKNIDKFTKTGGGKPSLLPSMREEE